LGSLQAIFINRYELDTPRPKAAIALVRIDLSRLHLQMCIGSGAIVGSNGERPEPVPYTSFPRSFLPAHLLIASPITPIKISSVHMDDIFGMRNAFIFR
jgi:hypothetical protein